MSRDFPKDRKRRAGQTARVSLWLGPVYSTSCSDRWKASKRRRQAARPRNTAVQRLTVFPFEPLRTQRTLVFHGGCHSQRLCSACTAPMACLLLTVTEVFTAISQSTAVCRDSVATNYVSGAPRTLHKHREQLWHREVPEPAEAQPRMLRWLPGWQRRRRQRRRRRLRCAPRSERPPPPCRQHSHASHTLATGRLW